MKSRILIPGSGEEYGEIHEDELPISENSILRPVNPYAVTKIAQDLIASVYFRSYGINVVRVRSFNHEGPRRDNVFGIPSYAYQIARIEQGLQEPIIKTGHTGDKRNFTHIRDLVELYLIGSDEMEKIYTYREIIDKLISLSNISEISVKQIPEYTRPTSVPRLIGDTSKFRNLTGWKPKISVDRILEDTLEYWRDFVKNNHY
jgi:GDP-4-dehydro-6-deoxy-D-mannose reductase